MGELLAIFASLPGYLKLVVIASGVMPLLVLWSYLFPPRPGPPPPADGEIIMPDGKRAKLYIDGDAYVKKPKRR